MEIKVYVASAFSKEGKGGNKAGVVFMDSVLTTQQKIEIAKQLGYAETAFISASQKADYKMEYFTPKEEVNLCGHATIGAFVILHYLNKLDKHHYTIDTKSGVLKVTHQDDMLFMAQNKPQFYEILTTNEFDTCFNAEVIDSHYPIQIVSTGLKDILIPIKSEQQLQDIQPDFNAIKAISERYDVIGTHLYTCQDDRIICRNFAPLYDINEEAATGTSNGALACYLYEKHHIEKPFYVFEQGYALASPSEIIVKLDTLANKVEHVYVGGKGYYCETKYVTV